MERYNISILGLSEVRREGESVSGDYKVIYKGGENKEKGVGVLYKKDMDKSILKVMPISDRIVCWRLKY